MKHLLVFILLSSATCLAQNASDALLYSTEYNYGTARHQAMGGAMGALGGDLSAINDNPASSAVFNRSEFTGSISVNHKKNEISQTTNTDTKNGNFNLNQVGGVSVIQNKDHAIHKITFAFNYGKTESYEDQYYIESTNPNGISNYFLNLANGIEFQNLLILPNELIEEAYLNIGSEYGYDTQQAFLGYYGGIIDPVDSTNPENTAYIGTGTYSNVNQKYLYNSSGHKSVMDLNIGAQYKKNLYLGASVKIHTIENRRSFTIQEDGYNTNSDLKKATFSNNLNTYGTGLSAQFGIIKITNNGFRFGAAIKTPTYFKITEELTQSIHSNLADTDIKYIGENQVNIFQPYKLRSPLTLTGSVAYVIGKKGLISMDYHYRDFNNMKLKPSNEFNPSNNYISSNLRNTSELNIGGEYRIKRISFRAGYQCNENPLKNAKNRIRNIYSFGTGYRFNRNNLDISFSRGINQFDHSFFKNTAEINQKRTNTTITYTYKF